MARRLSSLLLLSVLSLFLLSLSSASSHFEGFDADEDSLEEDSSLPLHVITPTTLTPTVPHSDADQNQPPLDKKPNPSASDSSQPSDLPVNPTTTTTTATATSFDLWDEDEFEGLPQQQQPPPEQAKITENVSAEGSDSAPKAPEKPKGVQAYTIEIVCGSFLIIFAINYFTGAYSLHCDLGSWIRPLETTSLETGDMLRTSDPSRSHNAETLPTRSSIYITLYNVLANMALGR